MPVYRQMFDHTLDAIKGWLPGNMGSVDKSAKLSAEVTVDPVYAGRVAHVNDEDEFELGVTGTQMAVFLFQNSDDSDVSNDGGDQWSAISPTGVMSGMVAIGAYELESTEYDSAQTYHVNDPLRAVASNSNATTGGRLTNETLTVYTNACVGVVSKIPYANCHKKNVIRFWPVYLPGTTGN